MSVIRALRLWFAKFRIDTGILSRGKFLFLRLNRMLAIKKFSNHNNR